MESILTPMGRAGKQAARQLQHLSTEQKNQCLLSLAQHLRLAETQILSANAADLANASYLSAAMQDRLRLDPERLEGIALEVEQVARLADPIGEVFDQRELAEGLQLHRRRVPLGVVGVIYEARPNVTVDIASLCLKSGNASILRGGKETVQTNLALMVCIQAVLAEQGLSAAAVQLIDNPDRQLVAELLRLDAYVDMIIPRGGSGLHRFCLENSTIPVITGGIGVCHLFADAELNIERAIPVIVNAKVQRPTVCNALDTLLVHQDIAESLLPALAASLKASAVELRVDPAAYSILKACEYPHLLPAEATDFGTEFLGLVLSIRCVDSLEQALDHISEHSTGHSDGILTTIPAHAQRFQLDVDSAAVYVNASTRFTDGAQFGLGAEVAVSTQKLHARGPMALEGLTTYKWLVEGDWSVRP